MNRRTFAGMLAGAAVCSAGKFTTETLAQSKPPDVARMLEVTRVPGVAAAGIKEAKPYQLFAGVEHAGGPPVSARTRFPAASLSSLSLHGAFRTWRNKERSIGIDRYRITSISVLKERLER